MNRKECTLETMIKKGWSVVTCEQLSEILLEEVRDGAPVKRTRYPENDKLVYSRQVEDTDSSIYYPRYHTEDFYEEYMEVFFNGAFHKAMKMKTVIRTYKTNSQCYMGD